MSSSFSDSCLKNASQESSHSRLKKAFSRQNIQIQRTGNVWQVNRLTDGVQASILLPDSFALEQKAVTQLLDFAAVQSHDDFAHVCKACATPDFHPGSLAPVGAIVATTADLVIPAAIGTDINCGMRLIQTGISFDDAQNHREKLWAHLSQSLLQSQRNIPLSPQSFRALFDDGASAFLDSLQGERLAGLWQTSDLNRLKNEIASCIALDQLQSASKFAPPSLISSERALIRDPQLGTMGSGNHFVELQVVDQILDKQKAWEQKLREGDLLVMIHSGSRDVGFYVGQRAMDWARAAHPATKKHPQSGLYGLTGALAADYLQAMGVAARYAWLNRVALAELVRLALHDVFKHDQSRLVVDVPHNVVLTERGMNIHRKGATPAHNGDLALIPGSMGDYSYLVNGLGSDDWLWSCSHGAGRRVRRQSLRAAKPPTSKHLKNSCDSSDLNNWHCLTLREERRIEESPQAYKPITPVLEAQENAGLIKAIAKLRPWATFKA